MQARSQLNPQQQAAVLFPADQPLKVLAGAGSGKTKTLMDRIMFLLQHPARIPGNLLVVTFSRNAAQELKDRLAASPVPTHDVRVSTFHAFCLNLCREMHAALGLPPNITIVSSPQRRKLLIEALLHDGLIDDQSELSNPEMQGQLRKLIKLFGRAKSELQPESILPDELKGVFRRYNESLKTNGFVEFSDLLHHVIGLFRTQSDALQTVQRRFPYVLVDEFQDTSKVQFELLCFLAGHGRVTVVGDDDQSIYGFQGACVANFFSFDGYFRQFDPKTLKLEINYRSTGHIVDASGAVINKYKPAQLRKQLVSSKNIGEPVRVVECIGQDSEMRFVVEKIKELRAERGFRYGDFAILYRVNETGKDVRKQLKAAGISFCTQGETLYNQTSLERTLAVLRLALDTENDHVCSLAIPSAKTKTAKTVLEQAYAHRDEHDVSLFRAIQAVTKTASKRSGLRKFVTNFERVRRAATDSTLRQTVEAALQAANVRRKLPTAAATARKKAAAAQDSDDEQDDEDDAGEAENDVDLFEDLKAEAEVFDRTPAAVQSVVIGEQPQRSNPLATLSAFLDHVIIKIEEGEHLNLEGNELNKPAHRGKAAGESGKKVWTGTVHQAKGLQWPVVFVVRMSDDQFPLFGDQQEMQQEAAGGSGGGGSSGHKRSPHEDEERRLAYVAMSRAESFLFLTYPVKQSDNRLQGSRFLKDIPPEHSEKWMYDGERVYRSGDGKAQEAAMEEKQQQQEDDWGDLGCGPVAPTVHRRPLSNIQVTSADGHTAAGRTVGFQKASRLPTPSEAAQQQQQQQQGQKRPQTQGFSSAKRACNETKAPEPARQKGMTAFFPVVSSQAPSQMPQAAPPPPFSEQPMATFDWSFGQPEPNEVAPEPAPASAPVVHHHTLAAGFQSAAATYKNSCYGR